MAHFYFLSGGGNDFIALAEPPGLPSAEEIRSWTTRGLSLGADGLFVLTRQASGVRMDYYNADGGLAELCLNGTRCAARLAFHLGWAEGSVNVTTGAGTVAAEHAGEDRIRLAVPPPGPLSEVAPELEGSGPHPGWFLEVGVPHFVRLVEGDMASIAVTELGRRLRHHSAFATAGVNVSFARFSSPEAMDIRTYERGVEAETLACGTGVLASAAAALAAGVGGTEIRALTRGGFTLEVEAEVDEERRVLAWTLTGDARLVAEGELLAGAEGLPEPPGW